MLWSLSNGCGHLIEGTSLEVCIWAIMADAANALISQMHTGPGGEGGEGGWESFEFDARVFPIIKQSELYSPT